MILSIAALVALAGLLMYALCTNGKLAEIGRIMFFCGLFVLVNNGEKILQIGGH